MPPEAIKLYGQMNNTCGLATLLMILQPESHGMTEHLARWWGGVKNVIKAAESPQVEFNWERVLNYILLKTLKNPRLRAYAEEKLGDMGIEYFIGAEGIIQKVFERICMQDGPRGMFLKNSFESSGSVCDPLLQVHLNIMKEDPELKILYLLFGGRFQHRYEAIQPTGAINFTRAEIKEPTSQEFQKKIKILDEAIHNNHKILLGLGHHWMAVKTIKSFEEDLPAGSEAKTPRRNYFTYVLDPEFKQEKTLPFQRIGENYMFYIFEHDETQFKAGLQLIEEVLKEEFPKDAEVRRRFLANEVGDEESLKKQLKELFGAWPLPEEEREKVEAELEEEEEAESRVLEAESMEKPKPLPTEEEMTQKLRVAIKKAFSDYSKV